jgi:hypothetical protein
MGCGIRDSVDRAIEDIKSGATDLANGFNREAQNLIDNIARSDVGHATGAFLSPVTSTIRGTEKIFKGDFRAGARAIIGGLEQATNPVQMLSQASSSFKEEAERSDLNKVSFDFFKTNARAGEVTQRWAQGGPEYDSDTKTLVEASLSQAKLAAATYTAGQAYSAYAAGNTANAAVYAAGTQKIYETGKIGSALDGFVPGLGKIVDSISEPQPPGFDYSRPSTLPSVSYAPTAPVDNKKIIIAGIVLLGAVIAAKKSKAA